MRFLKGFVPIAVIVVLILTSCSREKEADVDFVPKGDYRYLLQNNIEILPGKIEKEEKEYSVKVNFPQIRGLKNQAVEKKINEDLRKRVTKAAEDKAFIPSIKAVFNKDYKKTNIIANYQSPASNYNNVLSIRVFVSWDTYRRYEMKTVTFNYDLNTGNALTLKDLFTRDTDYVSTINRYITKQILRDNLEETQLAKPFESISEDQKFTVGLDQVTVFFDSGNPYFPYGVREFAIPFQEFGSSVAVYEKYCHPGNSLYQKETLERKMLPNRVEIRYKSLSEQAKEYFIECPYVQLSGLQDKTVEEKINRLLEEDARQFAKDPAFVTSAKKNYEKQPQYIAAKHRQARIPASFSDIICIHYWGGKSIPPNAAGEFFIKGFNFSLKTGNELKLKDLFNEHVDYAKIINDSIKMQITNRYQPAKPVKPFTGVSDHTQFYFNETTLFIYFLPGELMEASRGPIEFDIPFTVFGEGAMKILE